MEIQTEAIIDVIFGDSDTDTYNNEPTDKLLARWDKQKKDNHGKHCHKKRKISPHFFFLLMEFLERRPWSYS